MLYRKRTDGHYIGSYLSHDVYFDVDFRGEPVLIIVSSDTDSASHPVSEWRESDSVITPHFAGCLALAKLATYMVADNRGVIRLVSELETCKVQLEQAIEF